MAQGRVDPAQPKGAADLLLVLILAFRLGAPIVDEPSFLLTKRRQPECTRHQLGEGNRLAYVERDPDLAIRHVPPSEAAV